MTLTSFETPLDVAVFGTGGIGRAFIQHLADDPGVARVHAISRTPPADAGKVRGIPYDPERPKTLAEAADTLPRETTRLVVCTIGTLHDSDQGPEKSLKDLDPARFLEVVRVNALLPALVGQAVLPLFKARGERRVFAALSARVGSISDNRLGGWHSYRASKAALNQLVRNMALEIGRRNDEGIAVTLHPGTVDTALSAPFKKNVPDGKLFAPDYSAGKLLGVIDALTPSDSGKCFDYAGEAIAP